MKIKECAICGETPMLEKTQAWNGSHGYYGNYWYSLECKKCQLPKSQSVSDIYQSEDEAKKMVIDLWNKEQERIENYLKEKV